MAWQLPWCSVCVCVCVYVCVSALLLSCVLLFVTPWSVVRQGPLSMGILQARILEWVAILFSRGSSWPRNGTWVSCSAAGFFTGWATRKALPWCPSLTIIIVTNIIALLLFYYWILYCYNNMFLCWYMYITLYILIFIYITVTTCSYYYCFYYIITISTVLLLLPHSVFLTLGPSEGTEPVLLKADGRGTEDNRKSVMPLSLLPHSIAILIIMMIVIIIIIITIINIGAYIFKPVTGLSVLLTFLTTAPWGRYFYFHQFTAGEIKASKVSGLIHVSHGVSSNTSVENLPASAEDAGDGGLIPGSGISPAEGNANPLQYSCLENPMNRGAWLSPVPGSTKSQTRLSTHAHTEHSAS